MGGAGGAKMLSPGSGRYPGKAGKLVKEAEENRKPISEKNKQKRSAAV
jgi:hypothetical protein